jgi:hypothetical protein
MAHIAPLAEQMLPEQQPPPPHFWSAQQRWSGRPQLTQSPVGPQTKPGSQ